MTISELFFPHAQLSGKVGGASASAEWSDHMRVDTCTDTPFRNIEEIGKAVCRVKHRLLQAWTLHM